jgi:hypothetical protein
MRRLIAVSIVAFPAACQAVTGNFSVVASDGGADSAASGGDAASDQVESASDAMTDVVEAGTLDAPGADAPSDVLVDAVTEAEAGPVCLTDLSNVGTGDFQIAFTLTTTAGSVDMALLNQRIGCDETTTWWDVSYIPSTSTTGGLAVATDDGTHYVIAEQATGAPVDDGKPHHIVVARVGGQLGFSIDGVTATGPIADPYSFDAMPPLRVGTDDCPGFEATVGTITEVCLTRP